jgi:hypothetical protein
LIISAIKEIENVLRRGLFGEDGSLKSLRGNYILDETWKMKIQPRS